MPQADNETFRLDWSARLMLIAVLSSIFLVAMDQTVVSTALPTIVHDLNGLAELPWIVTAYLLTSTVFLPVYGKLGDVLGRKYLLQLAILLFLAGSALSGLAQNIYELILFRALQGAGGGGLMVTAIASISDFIPLTRRGRYQGLIGAVFGLATLVGPLLGGVIVELLNWRWIFYINVPIGVFSLAVIGAAFPKPSTPAHWAMDAWGTLFLVTGLSAIVLFASLAGPVLPWSSPWLWLIFVSGLISSIGFFIFEKRHPHPLLPLAFFKFRTFTLSVAMSFFAGLAMLGSTSFLPIYLQDVRHFSPTESGLELLYLLIGTLVTSILSGRQISRKQRYKEFPILGSFLITAALGGLSRIDGHTPLWYLAGTLTVLGLGLGMTTQVLVLSAQLAVPHKNLGVATSTVTLFRSMGGTLGVAAFGAVFSGLMANTAAPAEHSALIIRTLHTDFLVAAVFSLTAFLGAWFLEDMQVLLRTRQNS